MHRMLLQTVRLLLLFAVLASPALPWSAPAVAEETSLFSHGFWPFRPPVRARVGEIQHAEQALSAIDRFVLVKLQGAELQLNEPAGRPALLRRVTFGLTGLPPTRQDLAAFNADSAPDAYERVVDRLLASPAFAERWAQHWLDVVRYAETDGFKADKLRPNAYRYRDYVIQSFHCDRPYDEFVRQQLAGDQLDPDNPDAIVATGLNRLYPDEDNAANLFQRRQEILNDLTETSGLAFMGLTMGCAQCHDHKFDDILQTDFYRMQAFFAPMTEQDDALLASRKEIQQHEQKHAEWEAATAGIRRQMEQLLAPLKNEARTLHLSKFRAEIQEAYLTPASQRTALQEQIARMVAKQLDWRFNPDQAAGKLPDAERARYQKLKAQLSEFDSLKPEPLPRAMAVGDVGPQAPPTYLLDGGNWQKPTSEVEPGFPEFLGGDLANRSYGNQMQSGRRAALASWMTLRDHPLTTRVIVNRMWHHHLGRGIVPTPNDFGNMGEPPTHPEALDWLAVQLVEHNWSLKQIHRLITTSAVYRQSARIQPDSQLHKKAVQVDGENKLLWRARRRRLEGEAIRDAMLLVSNRLNRRMFGPSSRPPLPPEISPRYAWKASPREADHFRRSIYTLAQRNMRYPLFDVFDLPDMHNSCAARAVTTNAPQALLMLNSQLVNDLAHHWAWKLVERYDENTESLIRDAYLTAYARPAELSDIAIAQQFLAQQQASGVPIVERTAGFCHALFNSNEFVYVD